jgi:hypothetical protein
VRIHTGTKKKADFGSNWGTSADGGLAAVLLLLLLLLQVGR